MWDQLLPRGIKQISLQEALALPLLQETFAERLKGLALTLYVDNLGVVGSTAKGNGSAPESNSMIVRFWLKAAELDVLVVLYQVEGQRSGASGLSWLLCLSKAGTTMCALPTATPT